MTRRISRAEAISALRAFRRFGSAPLEITCANADAVPFRDVIELYLWLTGTRSVTWRDSRDRIAESASLVQLIANGLSDLLAWPREIVRHRYRAARCLTRNLAGPRRRLPPKTSPARALYLRSDHWFDIRGGGSVGHVRGVIEGFRQSSIPTTVASTDRLSGITDDADFHLIPPLYYAGRNVPGIPELTYNDQMIEAIERHWLDWCPDFIYQRMSMGNYVGAWLRHKHSVPYIVEYNGSIAWMARHWDKRPLLLEKTALALEQSALASADLVVVVSEPSRDELVARGIRPDRILVNPNGVDPDIYRPDIDGSGVRQRYGLVDAIVIGFIGTFGKWHGANVLAQSFIRLLRERQDLRGRVKLMMIGDGVMRNAAEACLQEAGLADQAIFTGLVPQDQGPMHLAACDILASPHVPNPDGTPFFGSPTKLFEYMAMGKAIVASDLDQIGEILQPDETAVMVQPGSEEQLASALARLVDDPQLRVRLGEAARHQAVADYSWAAHTARILAALGRDGMTA